MRPPKKIQRGDCSATLPNRSGRYQGTTPTTWLNVYTPCKSQLQNAWPVSPTTWLVLENALMCTHTVLETSGTCSKTKLERNGLSSWLWSLFQITTAYRSQPTISNQPVTLDLDGLYMCFLKRIETSELEMC